METLVVYACHVDNENVQFFLRHGMFESAHVKFVLVINNPSLVIANIPKWANVVVHNRENVGMDFGAWSYGLKQEPLIKAYKWFVFINSSVRGPFLPVWFKTGGNWTELFTGKLNEVVKLVGTTINVYNGLPHVQSMVMALDQTSLALALQNSIFNLETVKAESKDEIVASKEVSLSILLLKAGYNIACLQIAYKDVDWRLELGKRTHQANTRYGGDCYFPNAYFDQNVHPYEVIFFKTNRNVTTSLVHTYTQWHARQNICC